MPHAKIVIMLREPVKRLISAYWFFVQVGSINVTQTEWIARDCQRELFIGLYQKHLEHWMSVFPRDQVHVVLFEEYVAPKSRQSIVDGVCRFLEVEPTLAVARREKISNKTAVPRSHRLELVLNSIRLRYGLPGYTVKWFEPEKGRYRFLNRILERVSALNNSYSRRYQPWPAEISDRLQTYYRHENAGLSELIGRDVDAIWYGGDRKESAMDQLANVVQ